MKPNLNEIIIAHDGTRTIIGEIAHNLALAGPQGIFKLCEGDVFHVFECVKGGAWVLRASCSDREAAVRYWTDGRVLVTDNRHERRGASIVPTEHEKAEWARMARAAYAEDKGQIGSYFAGLAAMRQGQAISLSAFDSAQRDYRAWLNWGFQGILNAPRLEGGALA
jgi:hypothetical protein